MPRLRQGLEAVVVTHLRALAHRIRHGHWRQPWQLDLGFGGATDDKGCRACVRKAVMRDIADSERRIGGGGW